MNGIIYSVDGAISTCELYMTTTVWDVTCLCESTQCQDLLAKHCNAAEGHFFCFLHRFNMKGR